MELNFSLHPAQSEIFLNPARFKVVAAGRRFGKSYLAHVILISEALKVEKDGKPLDNINVAYVAPTFKQARQIMWSLLKNALAPMKPSTNEQDGIIRLPNGRKIYVFGADQPDNMRGNAFSYVVLDEFAQMRPDTWTAILRPALADVKGGALFIGTPQGKNHFYELFLQAGKAEGWEGFTYRSVDNPYMDPAEIEAASQDMPAEFAAQEFRATFTAFGGLCFKEEWIQELDEPPGHGEIYITVDLSGFDEAKKRHGKTLDDTAIAVVMVGQFGWYVLEVITGRWNVRETAVQILMAARKYRPQVIGIEKGPLKQAVWPYMVDNMKRLGVFPAVADLTHGNKNKQGRIQWALQGRLEQGRLMFRPGEYMGKLKEQLADFPNPMAHDDMIDALAYVDQVSHVSYHDEDAVEDDFVPLDDIAGF